MVLLNLLKQVKLISKCELLFENVIKGCPLAQNSMYNVLWDHDRRKLFHDGGGGGGGGGARGWVKMSVPMVGRQWNIIKKNTG